VKRLEYLRDKANSLPQLPGVYVMKDSEGTVIYVGKSKKLKNRVTSYFVGSSHNLKTARMTSLVSDFDYIVCQSEIEALALENVLIKKYSPKYNIRLKDAKSYPYIKVTNEEYPKLFVCRERRSDGASYYGPYKSTSQAHSALDTVMRIFSLATCKRSFPRDIGKQRPCIYKEMKTCIAPCDGSVAPSEYRELVKCACRVLSGNVREVRLLLAEDMERASENLEFERAALLRDSIKALDALVEKQKVVADLKVSRDVFALSVSEFCGALAVLNIRGGALINKNEFILTSRDGVSSEDVISVIADYYDGMGSAPREIMLDFELDCEDAQLLSDYLSLGKKYRVQVKFPERGEGRALCEMARKNAEESARQYKLDGEREDKNVKRLAALLGIEAPRRIEAYDISNLGNENINASMVVFSDGKLKKSDYRIFSIKGISQRDDYASMREALSRRLAHVGDGSLSLGDKPDLILVDGGAGHVSAAKQVLKESGVDTHVFGMVKDEYHKTRAITDGEREISIAREMDVYAFVYKLQEEAHRFAVKHTMGQKRKSLTHSSLEKISGIGEKKARALLSAMPLKKIKTQEVSELSKIQGISENDARKIYDYFHKK
jgi:excinuclease ABC subunit C